MLRFCGGVRMVLRATFGIHIAVTYRSFSCYWGLLTYWKFHQHPRLHSGRAGTQAGLNKVFLGGPLRIPGHTVIRMSQPGHGGINPPALGWNFGDRWQRDGEATRRVRMHDVIGDLRCRVKSRREMTRNDAHYFHRDICIPPHDMEWRMLYLRVSWCLAQSQKPCEKWNQPLLFETGDDTVVRDLTPMPATARTVFRVALRGEALLTSSWFNKGTAFSLQERREFGLNGRLPSKVATLDEQCQRAYDQLNGQGSPLQKNGFLQSLKDQNRVLYFALLWRHLRELIPIIYTPTEVRLSLPAGFQLF